MAPPAHHKEYVGCRLTVLTKSGIRYEGTLFDLNQRNATVSLSEVRVHGTEGRAESQGKPEIPPTDTMFKYLIFSGNDIKDLVVLNSPNDVQHHDPAIIAVNVAPKEFNAGLSGNHQDLRRRVPGQRSPWTIRDGGILNTMFNADELKKECQEKDYDFDEANKNVDKQKIAEELMNTAGGKQLLQSGYKPEQGFYDTISNDLTWSRGRQVATVRPLL